MDSALPINRSETSTTVRSSECPKVDTGRDWLAVTRGVAQGKSDSLTHYYEFAFDLMLHEIARVSGRDEQTCLDIVHEAMLKVIRSIKPLPTTAAVVAWSRAVAKTTTYDWLRRDARRRKLHDAYKREQASATNEVETGETDLARLAWIEEQLAELPNDLQNLISLRYRMGWSLKKIGQRVGLKTGAVDGRIRRAMEQIKKKAGSEEHLSGTK